MTTRRDVLQAAAASLVLAGVPTIGLARSIRNPALAKVDPEMRAALADHPTVDFTATSLPQQRYPRPKVAAPLVERMIPGLPGQPPVRTIQFDGAPSRRARPAVLWIHGGGYVSGAASIGQGLCELATARGWLVVSVDYRLAPQARLASSLADTYAALRWVHDNADQLGVDRGRIAVGGASAGGGHAAMLALAARDRREVALAYQVLIYPMLDDRTGSARPARLGTGDFIWTAASNRFGWSSLLGVPAGSVHVPPRAVPARRTDLAGLPPAFIGVGTLDLFLDEDIAYADSLTAAGVAVDLAIVPGAYHAFDGIAANARASRAFTARWQDDLSRALA